MPDTNNGKKIDHEKVKSLVTELLAALGEDPNPIS